MAVDLFKLLFFPGLAFLLVIGATVLSLEEGVKAALYGGGVSLPFPSTREEAGRFFAAAGDLVTTAFCLCVPAAGFLLLAGKKGDLLLLALFAASCELGTVLAAEGTGGEKEPFLSLALRSSLARTATLFCLAVGFSLLQGESPAAPLAAFSEGRPLAALPPRWEGPHVFFVLSLAAGGLALIVFLAHPHHPLSPAAEAASDERWTYSARLADLLERPLLLALATVIIIGYPWGGMGAAAWTGAAAGGAAAVTALRGWARGLDRVLLRRAEKLALILSLLSFILATAYRSW